MGHHGCPKEQRSPKITAPLPQHSVTQGQSRRQQERSPELGVQPLAPPDVATEFQTE